MAGFSLFIYIRQVQVLRSETKSRLTSQASQLEMFFGSDLFRQTYEFEEELEHLPNFSSELPLLREYDRFALLDGNGKIIQRSEHFSTTSLTEIYNAWLIASSSSDSILYRFSGQEETELEHLSAAQAYLFIGTPFNIGQREVGVLLLGSPMDPEGQLPRLVVALAVVFVLILLIAFAGGFWLAHQAMHPVQVITRTARAMGEDNLHQRLDLTRTDELGELASTFDDMLDRLQAAFERQRQFTADASHELRTPLTIIELEANRGLERIRSSDEYQEILKTIRSENAWMSQLVNELLTLARFDSGRTVLRLEPVDLAELAEEVTGRLNTLAGEKRVALSTGLLDESVSMADRDYLMHVLVNLVENGINYADGIDSQVIVETGQGMRDGKPWAWFRVSDNGPGIPHENLPNLFDRFYQVDEARSKNENLKASIESSSGSGLGLAIAQAIVQAHHGIIEVVSQLGQGTTFTVWLPLAKSAS